MERRTKRAVQFLCALMLAGSATAAVADPDDSGCVMVGGNKMCDPPPATPMSAAEIHAMTQADVAQEVQLLQSMKRDCGGASDLAEDASRPDLAEHVKDICR